MERIKKYRTWFHDASSLLRSRFFGCHATLPPKKWLLPSEQHSFPLFDQSQLLFHFREPFRAKFTILNNQRSFFIFPSHGGSHMSTRGDNGDSWRTFPWHVFPIQNCEPKCLPNKSLQCRTLSSRRTISSLMCRNHLSKICLASSKSHKQLDFNHVVPERPNNQILRDLYIGQAKHKHHRIAARNTRPSLNKRVAFSQ